MGSLNLSLELVHCTEDDPWRMDFVQSVDNPIKASNKSGDKEDSCSELRKVRMTSTSVIQVTELKTIKRQIFITRTKSERDNAADFHNVFSSSSSSSQVSSSAVFSSASSSSESPGSSAAPSAGYVNCPICGE